MGCVSPSSLTREQVRRIDRLAVEQYGLPGIVLMENAGRNAARVIRRQVLGAARGGRVAIVCGAGNNGGDGFCIGRHLANCGVDVKIYLAADAGRVGGDAATNLEIVRRMGLPLMDLRTAQQIDLAAGEWRACDAVIDALLGTGFAGEVRGPLDRVIEAINAARAAAGPGGRPVVVAVDVPSGLDADSGQPSNVAVRADLTITMVAPKAGFEAPTAPCYTGRVVVVDIGAPRMLIESVAGRVSEA